MTQLKIWNSGTSQWEAFVANGAQGPVGPTGPTGPQANAFQTFSVTGASSVTGATFSGGPVVADSISDTLSVIAGKFVSLTGDATNDTIKFDVNAVTNGSWTPTLGALTTTPTLGTGSSQLGSYTRIGDIVVATFYIKFGTSGVAAGSGGYFIGSLPWSISTYPNSSQRICLGKGAAFDSSAARYYEYELTWGASSLVLMRYLSVNGTTIDTTLLTGAAPVTWAASDEFHGQFVYIATS